MLSPDRPKMNPCEDRFDQAPFAQLVAKGLLGYTGEECLVTALYGPWGSGKTTVLNFIRYFLQEIPKNEEKKPIILEFNPWLFSGKEDLAKAFLNQFQSVLVKENKNFKELKEKLAIFAQNIGSILDLSGFTGGTGKEIGEILSKILKPEPQNIAVLKEEIRKILLEEKTRILVFIDDIDRLDKDEARQLFGVIRALADFPYMLYILAFDRESIAETLDSGECLSGDRFLEKIIQVPFEIPLVDKTKLQKFLFDGLDSLIDGHSAVPFDSEHWSRVFLSGLDSFFLLPRDVVRFINSISVTFPAICKEVNPADFIAMEAIRVFKPGLYDFIRSKKADFTGVHPEYHSSSREKKREEFLSALKKMIPEKEFEIIMNILAELFPNIGNESSDKSWLQEWRRVLRVCHPDIFPVYFRFSLPPETISHMEVMDLINSASNTDIFSARLQQLKKEQLSATTSKLTAMLDRLLDHGEKGIPEDVIASFITVFLSMGDELRNPEKEDRTFTIGNDSRIVRLLYMLVKRFPIKEASSTIYNAIKKGSAIHIQGRLLSTLADEKWRSSQGDTPIFPDEDMKKLQNCWTSNLPKKLYLDHGKLRDVLFLWSQLEDKKEKVRTWCSRKIRKNKDLIRFVSAFLGYTRTPLSIEGEKKSPRLNPRNLEPFIDIDEVAHRLQRLQKLESYEKEEQIAVSQFLKEYELLKEGKDPDYLNLV